MTLHLIVHWLDDIRHEFPGTLSWEAVKTNLGASVWQVGVAIAVWPKLRKWLHAEWKKEESKVKAEAERVEARVRGAK